MTDPSDPLDPIDELDALASDHLDGRTAEARLATDSGLAARVAALEAARAALRAPVRVDGTAREAAIAAALDAFDEAAAREASGPLRALTAPAVGRAPSRRALQLVAIAAALVLLALAVPLLAALDRGDDAEDTAATALDDDASGGQGGDLESSAPSAAEDSAGGGSAQAHAVAAPEHLGAFADLAGLADAVRAAAPGPAGRAVPSTMSDGAAGSPEAALSTLACGDEPAAGETSFRATATVAGRAVVVLVRATPAGDSELVVLDAADCSVVATRPL